MQRPRVISGKFKSKKLPFVSEARPLTDILKTKIFDRIDKEYIITCSVLDLYAGSGSFGFEALSRGARFCTFVESSSKSARLLKNFINENALNAKVEESEVLRYLKSVRVENFKFDLIFADPPFCISYQINELIRIINNKKLLFTYLIVRHQIGFEVQQDGLSVVDYICSGKSVVSFFRNKYL